MKIKTNEIVYEPGTRDYQQRVKGKKNYNHSEFNKGNYKDYNGYGGVHNITPSELTMYGETEDGSDIAINIKHAILTEFERENLSDSFILKLEEKMPEHVEVETNEYGNLQLTKESCEKIYRNIHPKKAKIKYGK